MADKIQDPEISKTAKLDFHPRDQQAPSRTW